MCRIVTPLMDSKLALDFFQTDIVAKPVSSIQYMQKLFTGLGARKRLAQRAIIFSTGRCYLEVLELKKRLVQQAVTSSTGRRHSQVLELEKGLFSKQKAEAIRRSFSQKKACVVSRYFQYRQKLFAGPGVRQRLVQQAKTTSTGRSYSQVLKLEKGLYSEP